MRSCDTAGRCLGIAISITYRCESCGRTFTAPAPGISAKADENCPVPALFPPVEHRAPISILEIDRRVYNCLRHRSKRARFVPTNGIETIADLLQWSAADVLKIQYFGRKALKQLQVALQKHSWHLRLSTFDPP